MDNDNPIRDLPPVLSTEEVAELLRLNARTVLAMARDGRLPAHRLPGSRKVQYLASEVLDALARAPAGDDTDDAYLVSSPPVLAVVPEPGDVDPCDVWGAAPAQGAGHDHRERCRDHWTELARCRGLSPIEVTAAIGHVGDQRSAGVVEIDGLLYEVRVGPRQRVRYLNDDGDVCWGLIDAVWVEPQQGGTVVPSSEA